MLLPRRAQAYVPSEKLTKYLLSLTHVVGKTKAQFFRAHGYDERTAAQLEEGLLAIAQQNEVVEELASPHGTKYVVDGTLPTPRGTNISIRTVWIVEAGESRPRFVTAYPR